ncbi:hypothetical protein CNEO4_80013 [Clostridium neonatale]|nr:hypothetical protein CNEO4_80013 [Clostridium neonatale]
MIPIITNFKMLVPKFLNIQLIDKIIKFLNVILNLEFIEKA